MSLATRTTRSTLAGLCVIGVAVPAAAQIEIVAPPTNSVEIDFDGSPLTPGPRVLTAGDSAAFDDGLIGEGGFVGTFSGGDAGVVTLDTLAGGGPTGQAGDNAARMTVEPADAEPFNFFAGTILSDRGFELAPSGFDDGTGLFEFADVSDANIKLDLKAPAGTTVRVRIETGFFDFTEVPGFEGASFTLGSLGQDISATGDWQTVDFDLSDANTTTDEPFFFREPRAALNARLVVVYPAPTVGEVLIDNVNVSGSSILNYADGDVNQDGLLNAADIDDLSRAIRALAVGQEGDDIAAAALPFEDDEELVGFLRSQVIAQFDITPELENAGVGQDDRERLVREILGTQFGDFDVDGDVDAFDLGIWQTGFGTTEDASVLDGDADGDGDVDAFDLGIWQTGFGFGQEGAAVPEPATIALLGAGVMWLGRRRR